MDVILGFLATKAGMTLIGAIAGVLGKTLTDYVKGTKTEMDDKVLRIVVKTLREVVEEFEFGQAEEVLEILLEKIKLAPVDTTEVEKELEKEVKEVKK